MFLITKIWLKNEESTAWIRDFKLTVKKGNEPQFIQFHPHPPESAWWELKISQQIGVELTGYQTHAFQFKILIWLENERKLHDLRSELNKKFKILFNLFYRRFSLKFRDQLLL
jgi:hypothetical protein